jgi:hypothetical protein
MRMSRARLEWHGCAAELANGQKNEQRLKSRICNPIMDLFLLHYTDSNSLLFLTEILAYHTDITRLSGRCSGPGMPTRFEGMRARVD